MRAICSYIVPDGAFEDLDLLGVQQLPGAPTRSQSGTPSTISTVAIPRTSTDLASLGALRRRSSPRPPDARRAPRPWAPSSPCR